MRPDSFLVLDQGGHASRAMVYAGDGTLLASSQNVVATHRPAPGRVEQDPTEIIDSLVSAIGEVAVSLGRSPVAGLACQRSSVVCWRRSTGESLTPVLSWQDTRAEALFATRALDPDEVTATTGLPPSAHYGATKLAWCLEHEPTVGDALLDGDLCMGPLASFITYRLLAERPFVASATLAQRTLLLDVRTRAWSRRMLDAFGLPDAVLPAVSPDVGAFGTLRVAGSMVPLALCVGDQNVVPFVAGPPVAGQLYVNAGTGAFLLAPLPAGHALPSGLLCSLRPDAGVFVEGTVNGAGSAVSWFEEHAGAAMPWSALDGLSAVPVGAPSFVNTVGDLGSPFWRTGAPTRFEPDCGTFVERAYAVVESIVFLMRTNIDRMRDGGIEVSTVHIGGGLARSTLLCRLLAAATGCTVTRAGDLEVTGRGVLALLGGATAPPSNVIHTPEAAWAEVLEERFRAFSRTLG